MASTNRQLAEVTHSFTRMVGLWKEEAERSRSERELSKKALQLVVQQLENLSGKISTILTIGAL